MIRWILKSRQLALLLLASAVLFISAGTELIEANYIGLLVSAGLALSVALVHRLAIASALMVLPTALGISYLSSEPLIQLLLLLPGVLLISVMGDKLARRINFWSSFISAMVIAFEVGYSRNFFGLFFALSTSNEGIRTVSMLMVLFIAVVLFLLAMLSGRIAFVSIEHIGSPQDRAKGLLNEARLVIEISKQNERLEIAKDLSELLVQRVNAVVSATEGAQYSIKADPNVAGRVLERTLGAAKDAQTELRRLYDYLNGSIISEVTLHKIADLNKLAVAMREYGYNTIINKHGESFELNDGMELCVYKIVFESLLNVKKHAPVGTEITVDFLWVEDSLQVLVKDNGIEFGNRQKAALGEIVGSYDAHDDLESLVSELDGSTISALRDRASIYGGRIEVTKVPGVGFTLSAIFPNLREQVIMENK